MNYEPNNQQQSPGLRNCPKETLWQLICRCWRNIPSRLSYFFTFRNYYYIEVMQAFQKVKSEYITIKKVKHTVEFDSTTLTDIEFTIEMLFCDVEKERNYSKIWAIVHQIELLLIKIYDARMLLSHLETVRNNLYVLDKKDQELWLNKLNEFDDLNYPVLEKTVEKITEKNGETVTEKITYKLRADLKNIDNPNVEANTENNKNARIELLRAFLYTITASINEARRIEYMTNDLKRILLKRVLWCVIICGVISWVFAFSLIKDPLVNYAILLGLLGGFFSRLYSTNSLNFKPPAFALLAQYSYVQPLIGGIGAIIMYFILLSPLGTEIINDSLYLTEPQTQNYIINKYLADKKDSTWTKEYLPPIRVHTFINIKDTIIKKITPIAVEKSTEKKPKCSVKCRAVATSVPKPKADTVSIDTAKIVSNQIITKYPKPLMLLILAFLAGFSEKFFMGTINKIVGSRNVTNEPEEKTAKKEQETTTKKTEETKS